MDDLVFVCVIEGCEQIRHHVGGLLQRESLALIQKMLQIFALHKLHHDVGGLASRVNVFVGVVDTDHIGVLQSAR